MAHNDPFFVQIGSKKQFLRGFTNLFSELQDGNTSLILILMESPNIFCWKSTIKWVWSPGLNWVKFRIILQKKKKEKLLFWSFYIYILLEVYIYKHELVFIEIPEWKLNATSGRITIFSFQMKKNTSAEH